MQEKEFKRAAHDLNNILTGINNNIFYLKELNELPPNIQKVISNLAKDAERATDIVQNLLAKKTTDKLQLDKLHVNDVVQDVIDSVKLNLNSNINITYNANPDISPIIANKTDIYRIILNLITNSLEALHGKGKIVVETNEISDNVIIKVWDNGEGIKSENIGKIFDESFSTKDKKTESGLGLSFVKGKAESYNGRVEVSSQPYNTEFVLFFPALKKEPRRKHRILIAEDEDSVREVLSDLLESYNFIVTQTADGNSLIRTIFENSFDLLLVDKKLPGRDGLDCIGEIRKKGIDIPIILASGSDINDKEDYVKELKLDKVIKKPYNFPEIIDSIRKLI